MATRLYPHPGVVGPITTLGFGPSAPWSTYSSSIIHMSMSKPYTGAATQFAMAENSDLDGYGVRVLALVSDELEAQTIDGTALCLFGAGESSYSANLAPELYIRVMSGDGSTTRGVLYGGLGAIDITNEFGYQDMIYFPDDASTGVTLTPAVVLDGDRIVVELGYRAWNTSFSTFTGYIDVFGTWQTANATAAGQDATTLASWIEFSDTITFKNTKTGTVDVTVNPTATRSVSTAGVTKTGTVDVTVDPTATRTVGTASYMPSTMDVGVNLQATPRTGVSLPTSFNLGVQAGVDLAGPAKAVVPLESSVYVDVNPYAGLRLTLPAPTPPSPPASPVNSGGAAPPAAVGTVPVPKIRRISETYPTPTITNGRPS